MKNQVVEATQKLLAMWESGELPQAVAHTMLARQTGIARAIRGALPINLSC